MPSFDTAPDLVEANGLTALRMCGSFPTAETDWLTADSSAASVPWRAWNTICPP